MKSSTCVFAVFMVLTVMHFFGLMEDKRGVYFPLVMLILFCTHAICLAIERKQTKPDKGASSLE